MHEDHELEEDLRRLGRLVDACQSTLETLAGFEVSILSMLVALAKVPGYKGSWSQERLCGLLQLAPGSAKRLISFAGSRGLLDAREDRDGNFQIALTATGADAVRTIAEAVA